MRYLPVICLLFASFALAQDAPAPAVPPEYRAPTARDNESKDTLPASAANLASDAAIITIKGVCPQEAPSASASDVHCQTIVTKAQFEALTEALLPNMKDSRKRQLANAYPGLLAMAREAEARGVERKSRFAERLAFARLQILSQELVRQIEEESAKISDQDIDAYYHDHADTYNTAALERIFIPLRKCADALNAKPSTGNAAVQQKEAEDAMTRLAAQMRARAVAGEDFFMLQKQAYIAAGSTDVPPNPSLGQVPLSGLPKNHASVFDLKAGEISEVLTDSTGHYIYKLDAKTTEPLSAVKDSIRKILANERAEAAIQAVQHPVTTDFNPEYFGPPKPYGDSGDSNSQ